MNVLSPAGMVIRTPTLTRATLAIALSVVSAPLATVIRFQAYRMCAIPGDA